MLNVPEIFANGDMSIQGLYAYMGLPGYDPDFSVENIRKAFNIGALSSGIFSLTGIHLFSIFTRTHKRP